MGLPCEFAAYHGFAYRPPRRHLAFYLLEVEFTKVVRDGLMIPQRVLRA